MPARVTLEITQGDLVGEKHVFEERTTCIIGRGKDCEPKVPNDKEHQKISRHHCLLDINPPDVRVRDFGSLNGTHVNGRRIGRRRKGQTAEEAAADQFQEFDLKDGDEIRLVNTVFRVSVHVPVACVQCGEEIPPDQLQAHQGSTQLCLCQACRRRLAPTGSEAGPGRAGPRHTVSEIVKVCAKCGRDASQEKGAQRPGEYLCAACRADPEALVRGLFHAARSGYKPLVAVQGYEMVRELGHGGMGAVYLARHKQSGRQVALKVMLPQVAASKQASERFLREIENTKALRHANVVQLYDSGCSEGTFFFTLEYCDGGSVDRLMAQRGGRLPVNEAVAFIRQILEGLDYAHQAEIPCVQLQDGRVGSGRGLVHRDLKPQNIFLCASGRSSLAKVGDYGLAKAFDQAGLSGQTCTGTVAGTPQFMPRQQVIRFKFSMPEVDVWAAAASFYNMLTGHVPRNFTDDHDRWQTVLQTAPVPIRQRNPAIPARLAAVIDEALVDDPDIRIKSAAELKRAIEAAIR